MFDFKFNWDEKIDTRIEVIDAQHKELFRIGRDVEQLVITGCVNISSERLLNVICELREYAAYHFYTEEEIMEKYNYEGLEEHKKMHEYYMGRIVAIDCKKLGQDPLEQMKLIKDEIISMVFEHMLVEDHKMADAIRPRMTKEK